MTITSLRGYYFKGENGWYDLVEKGKELWRVSETAGRFFSRYFHKGAADPIQPS